MKPNAGRHLAFPFRLGTDGRAVFVPRTTPGERVMQLWRDVARVGREAWSVGRIGLRLGATFAGAAPELAAAAARRLGSTKVAFDMAEAQRGTYSGLAHPAAIEYLTGLGVTAVELLPVHQFVHDAHLIERWAACERTIKRSHRLKSLLFFFPVYSSSEGRC